MSDPKNPAPDDPGDTEAQQDDADSEDSLEPPSTEELAKALDVVRRELANQPQQDEPVRRRRSAEPRPSADDPIAIVSTAMQMAEMTSGPMPSSSEMAGYKQVDHALPVRIADAADDERRHRHVVEDRQSKADAFVSIAGVVGGWLCTLLMIGLAIYAVHEDQPGLAVGAIIAALAPVAVALVNRGKRD